MANAIPIAGMLATDTYVRWRTTGAGWLERDRLEVRAPAPDESATLQRSWPLRARA